MEEEEQVMLQRQTQLSNPHLCLFLLTERWRLHPGHHSPHPAVWMCPPLGIGQICATGGQQCDLRGTLLAKWYSVQNVRMDLLQ